MSRIAFRPRRAAPAVLSLLLAASLATACSVDAEAGGSGARPSPPVYACSWEITPVPGGQMVTGRIRSDRPVTGSYEILVRRTDQSGTIAVRTSGDFAAGPGAEGRTGSVTFNGRLGRHEIRMETRVGGRRIHCAPPGGWTDL